MLVKAVFGCLDCDNDNAQIITIVLSIGLCRKPVG